MRGARASGSARRGSLLHVVLVVVGPGLAVPGAVGGLNSFRDYGYTAVNGYVSFGGFTLDNYANAWSAGNFGPQLRQHADHRRAVGAHHAVPGLVVAFVLARFSWKLNLAMLVFFTAANLLPQQALLIPLFRFFLRVRRACTTRTGRVIIVHIAFQMGFCTFVLSNYMKTLPKELTRPRSSTGPASCGSTGRSSCRCAGRRSRRWPPCR